MQRFSALARSTVSKTAIAVPNTRPMSYCYGGNLYIPKPNPTAISTSPSAILSTLSTPSQAEALYHNGVFVGTCNASNCVTKNCADKQVAEKCPITIPGQTPMDIPLVAGTEKKFDVYIVGNLTKKIPVQKSGVVLNEQQNYSGQSKVQAMVLEPITTKGKSFRC